MNSSVVRKHFIDFFLNKKHTFVKPSPVIPQNDPTLLFINAGMNQFKDIFLGLGKRDYNRAVNSQLCIRVSGKHNDLEEVGFDNIHLTSFEMLGNWSFGDYYKKEAIGWAWELLTDVYALPKDKLYATYYKTDTESRDLWNSETDIPKDHILKFAEKDNFWEMGNVGPCGPCSEVHIDLGPEACTMQEVPGHTCAVNGDCDRFIELWNLVFIQYNRHADGSLVELPQKHVDTGAGLERITAYLQKTASVYETDLFTPIIEKIAAITGINHNNDLAPKAHRVIADHIRTATFAIADNVLPANDGRGYVLRRIIRRAVRFSKKLGIAEPLLHKLVGTVIDIMSDYSEDLPKRKDFIETVIESEERNFLNNLESGIDIFESITKKLISEHKKEICGRDAFKLYDTFGFPLDLTQMMAREKDLSVNVKEFQKNMEAQKNRSRMAKKQEAFTGEKGPLGGEARITKTEDEKIRMARHHTGTHLLHAALRQVLGTHVTQAGSLVDLDRLRFDFTHFKALSDKEVQEVENIVNETIKQDIKLNTEKMPLDEAKKSGAISLFGEKYEEEVKVVSIGDFSKELCGGTHLDSTGQIEEFKIISEAAISAGVRRIEAIAGRKNIESYLNRKKKVKIELIKSKEKQRQNLVEELSKFEVFVKELTSQDLLIKSFLELDIFEQAISLEIKNLDKILLQLKNQESGKNIKELAGKSVRLENCNAHLFAELIRDYDLSMLRNLADNLINASKNLIVVLGSEKDKKGYFLVKISKDVDINIDAPKILNKLNEIAGGKGGGRPDMAQAGGVNPKKIDAALSRIKTFIEEIAVKT
ncbi:alanine--tRNA ligase [Candidatus Margulisiibacteriota bacterium]